MFHVAQIEYSEGNFKASVKLFEKVIQGRIKHLGESHSETLSAKAQLAEALDELGKSKKASKLRRAVLSQRMTFLGDTHPDTLHSLTLIDQCQ